MTVNDITNLLKAVIEKWPLRGGMESTSLICICIISVI